MSEVKVDTISERTTDAGVTVEGVKIEDGVATFQTAAGSPLVFEGATANAHETTFAITDPTQDNTITFPDSSFTVPTTGGKILQVFSTPIIVATASTTSTSFVDITGMTVDITPVSASNKVLVSFSLMTGVTFNEFYKVTLLRDTTEIFRGDAAGSRARVTISGTVGTAFVDNKSMTYLDSPSTTSATTYKLQWAAKSGDTIYLNRSVTDTDDTSHQRSVSSITVMEVAA
jgi:hypothetical protein